jgi:hypothetical protein
LTYNGVTILSIPLYDNGTEYEGVSFWGAQMGDCDDSDTDDESVGQDPVDPGGDDPVGPGGGDEEEVEDPVDSDPDDTGTGSSCLDVTVSLITDGDADEMAFGMSDLNTLDANGDPTIIFVYTFGELNNFDIYNEALCLDASGCYYFALLDQGGDGFTSETGRLDVTLSGETILSVIPGDLGTYDSLVDAMLWEVAFGNCNL